MRTFGCDARTDCWMVGYRIGCWVVGYLGWIYGVDIGWVFGWMVGYMGNVVGWLNIWTGHSAILVGCLDIRVGYMEWIWERLWDGWIYGLVIWA